MKKICVLLFIVVGFFLIQIGITYGLFESSISQNVSSPLARFDVYVNDILIGESDGNLVIDTFDIENTSNVRSGSIAPGSRFSFDVVLDPSSSEVAVRYDFTVDFSLIDNPEIRIDSIVETSSYSLVRTGEYTYSGIFSLDSISKGDVHTIKVNLLWNNNDDNNDKDYISGTGDEEYLIIPVNIKVFQYLGEELIEYVPDSL